MAARDHAGSAAGSGTGAGPRTIYLIRHGEKPPNPVGPGDPPATELVLSEPATQSETHVAAALAVLAAIAATDAICGLRLGKYSRGQDHDTAADLLETVDLADTTLVAKLRKVLAAKDLAHYSGRLIARRDAQTMVKNAAALVHAAEQL